MICKEWLPLRSDQHEALQRTGAAYELGYKRQMMQGSRDAEL